MRLVLGLDGGGTKTVLALADRNGQVTALRRGPGLDPSADPDWPQALATLVGADGHAVDAAILGLPFHDEVKHYSDRQSAVASGLITGNTLVQNDVRIAFDGALAGKPGVLALAGTGSMAWASLNGPNDPHIRTGGWGDAFGDEGSAYWIGREALAVVSRHLDGRVSKPEFCDGMLAAIGIGPDELIGWCYGLENRRVEFASLARVVSALSDAGNGKAGVILQSAGDHLVSHITAAWRRTGSPLPMRWSYAGGVFASRVVMDRISERLGSEPAPPRLPPVGGALWRAASNAGWPVDDAWIDRLAASLKKFTDENEYQQKGE